MGSESAVNIVRSFLFVNDKSFLIRNNGEQVSAGEIDGKIVGIYFSTKSDVEFTEKLKSIYGELKDQGERFEIVSVICHEDSEESFKETSESLPWLVLPFEDEREDMLAYHFRAEYFPWLAIIGKDGEVIRPEVTDIVEELGVHAYPFSPEKLAEFDAIETARLEAQTLESLLVDDELDFVIAKDGTKVSVSELVGKTILFYLSSSDCPPCRKFKPRLTKAYEEIKARDGEVEVVFVSWDDDQSGFDDSYSTMPWLALPFGDQRIGKVCHKLKLRCMPAVVAVGPDGRTITDKAKDFLMAFGSDAYPFGEDRLKGLVEPWPKVLKHESHQEHELRLTERYGYFCDVCGEDGSAWSYCCKVCVFDLDPSCALGIDGGGGCRRTDDGVEDTDRCSDGLVCTGEVCYRV